MEQKGYKKLSVFLSLILRHQPQAAGINLDKNGWADVEDLLRGMNAAERKINREILEEIVRTDEKGRYSFDETGKKIRANQGHSVAVDVELAQKLPPEFLYHGTASRFLDAIFAEGLKPMSRLYVHLSPDAATAVKVGKRHGKVVVLQVESGKMAEDGIKFYQSANGVWLTKQVLPKYLQCVSLTEKDG